MDGDHGPKVHHDLHTAIRATRLGGYIFVDDVSSVSNLLIYFHLPFRLVAWKCSSQNSVEFVNLSHKFLYQAYPDVKEAWEAITQGEKLVEQIECRSFGSVGNVERRSCLGVVKV